MRVLERNKQTIYYATYVSETANTESGYETGENTITYSTPVAIRVNVSPARGRVNVELFGDSLDYDRVVVTDDLTCPISETSVLWVDSVPDQNGKVPYDYIVRKVAKSLNSISYAISRVEVTL